MILLNTPSTLMEEVEEFIGVKIENFDMYTLSDAKTGQRKYPKVVTIDVNIFPGSSYGNITVRDVAMMDLINNLTTASYAGVDFEFTKKEDIIIKGVAEGIIDGLVKSDMADVRKFLEEEVGDLVRFDMVKKGKRNLVIFGFGRFDLSERVVEGGVLIKVTRREMRGGGFNPKIYWAKQYITDPPRAKTMDSPSKKVDADSTFDTSSSSRLQALDRQRADDLLMLREDVDRGLREQAERTIDLMNYQGRETTRAFSNTIVALNKHNNEVMILIQEANRIERKLATAQNCAKLYAVLQDENLRNLAPGFDAEANRLEDELKKVEEELRAANDKPVVLPEFTPVTRSTLLLGCENDATIKKKPEKPSPKKSTKRTKQDAQSESTESLMDTASLKKWSSFLTGSDPKYQAFLAKAMWRKDVAPLLADDLKEDPVRAIEVVGTLAAFIKAFGDCPESDEAEKKINDLIGG